MFVGKPQQDGKPRQSIALLAPNAVSMCSQATNIEMALQIPAGGAAPSPAARREDRGQAAVPLLLLLLLLLLLWICSAGMGMSMVQVGVHTAGLVPQDRPSGF